MDIRTNYCPPPIPPRHFDWSAVDYDTYDGAEDSKLAHQVGYGRTEGEAIAALLEILFEDEEITLDELKDALEVYNCKRYIDPDYLRDMKEDR